jgi:histone H3/H4
MATAPVPAPSATSGTGATTTKLTAKSSSKTATKAGGGTKTKKPVRKKVAKKSSGASSNQATWNASRAAQMELASQRNKAAARRSDPLWYRDEDVLPSAAEETPMAEHGKILPEQIQIVDIALSHNNLTRSDVTPQAYYCLLEQARRFALEIITDSQDYAYVASRTEISKADLELANSYRPDHPIALTAQLPKLNLLAQQVNRVPLPPIPTQCYSGVLLPPKAHQLTARTFDVVSGAQVAKKMVQPTPSLPSKRGSSKSKPSYGASRGRQISVNVQKQDQPAEAVAAAEGSTPPPGAAITEPGTPIQGPGTPIQGAATPGVPGAPGAPGATTVVPGVQTGAAPVAATTPAVAPPVAAPTQPGAPAFPPAAPPPSNTYPTAGAGAPEGAPPPNPPGAL